MKKIKLYGKRGNGLFAIVDDDSYIKYKDMHKSFAVLNVIN